MTNPSEQTALARTEPAQTQKTPIKVGAGGQLAPSDFDQLWRLSSALFKSGVMPDSLDSPEKVLAAAIWCTENRVPIVTGCQNICIVNGRLSAWGDLLVARVRASGKCLYLDTRIEGTGDDRVAVAVTARDIDRLTDQPIEVERRFSVEDAKVAGLWNGKATWRKYPERMLMARARAFLIRDVYADVLSGLCVAEEMSDVPETEPDPDEPPTGRVRVEANATEPATVEPRCSCGHLFSHHGADGKQVCVIEGCACPEYSDGNAMEPEDVFCEVCGNTGAVLATDDEKGRIKGDPCDCEAGTQLLLGGAS